MLLQGFQHMQMATGRLKPDIVVFNALLWDVARLYAFGPEHLQQETLRNDFVQLWTKMLDFWLQRIEVSDCAACKHMTAYLPFFKQLPGGSICMPAPCMG